MSKIYPLSVILFLSIILLSGCTAPSLTELTFEYAGAKDPVTIPKSTHTNIMLDFNVNVGSIILEVNPTASYLAKIQNEVSIREGSDGTLADAEEVTYSELDAITMKIQFFAQSEALQEDYCYNITITVANNISMEIDLRTTTGSISIDIADSSITINTLNLETTTGSISLSLEDIELSDPSPTVTTTTGNSLTLIMNVHYQVSAVWRITATTGEIRVAPTETRFPDDVSTMYDFDIECTTGKIVITACLQREYFGFKITASTTTGNIQFDEAEGGNTYTSPNYDSLAHRYYFDLLTTTGEIVVYYHGD